MFEYTKTVLKKVSFDAMLFCKEVQKAVQRLLPYEIEELKIFILFSCTAEPRIKSMFNLFKTIKKERPIGRSFLFGNVIYLGNGLMISTF